MVVSQKQARIAEVIRGRVAKQIFLIGSLGTSKTYGAAHAMLSVAHSPAREPVGRRDPGARRLTALPLRARPGRRGAAGPGSSSSAALGLDAVGAGGGLAAADDQPIGPGLRQSNLLVGGAVAGAKGLLFEHGLVVGLQQGPHQAAVGVALPDIQVDPLALVSGEGVVVLLAGRFDI